MEPGVPLGDPPRVAIRSAVSSAIARTASTCGSIISCTAMKCGPTTFQCTCLRVRWRSLWACSRRCSRSITRTAFSLLMPGTVYLIWSAMAAGYPGSWGGNRPSRPAAGPPDEGGAGPVARTARAMSDDAAVTSRPSALSDLAHAYDIATHYTDWQGRPLDVPVETVEDVLAAMDVDVTDPEAALRRRAEEPWRRMLPACVVVRQGEQRTVAVHVPDGDAAEVSLELETGGRQDLRQDLDRPVESREVDGRLVGEAV